MTDTVKMNVTRVASATVVLAAILGLATWAFGVSASAEHTSRLTTDHEVRLRAIEQSLPRIEAKLDAIGETLRSNHGDKANPIR
jgi:hypothetical protein